MKTLQITRIQKIAIETFKILNNLSPSYILDLVKFRNTNYSFRYQNLAELPRVNTESYDGNRLDMRPPISGTVSQMH